MKVQRRGAFLKWLTNRVLAVSNCGKLNRVARGDAGSEQLSISPLSLILAMGLAARAWGSAGVKFPAPPERGAVTAPPPAATAAPGETIGTDLNVALPAGDAARGNLLFHGK